LVDINHLSVACAAANAIVWGLGDHVLVYRADSLAQGDHRADAVTMRAQVLEHHRTVVRAARLAALLTPRTQDDVSAPAAAFAAAVS
jgi:hypothetical protein